jgi:hypothetical protein
MLQMRVHLARTCTVSKYLVLLSIFMIGLMDCADLNKTSDVKREAMVSKLHNMQWLKSTLHSSNPYV